MSLTQTNLGVVTKKQYFYKLKAHSLLLMTLAVVQLLALMFTFLGGGTSMTSSGTAHMNLSISSYSSIIIFIFSLFWVFVAAITLTTKSWVNMDFAFVSNRLSRALANAAFLITLGGLGGLTVSLGGVLLRTITWISGRGPDVIGTNFYILPGEFLLGALVTAFYLILVGTLGYFIGSLVQRNMMLIVIIPALLIGLLIMEARPDVYLIVKVVGFFSKETSPALFGFKTMAASVLLMVASVMVSQRTEVRR